MSTNHSKPASEWLDYADMPDWTKQIGATVRTVFEAMDKGRKALHDYKMLAAHGVAPQDAGKTVFQKHFAKR